MDRHTTLLTIGMLGFGPRTPCLATLMLLAEQPRVAELLIFWNEPNEQVSKMLQHLKNTVPKLCVVESKENLGSAIGYSRIIEFFRGNNVSDFLFLLDDDLLPKPDCIDQLMQTASGFSTHLDSILLLAYRPNLPEMHDLVSRKKGMSRPRPGACIGFHIINLVRQHREPVCISDSSGVFSIESAPWGGLLIPRAALPILGLPREDFFLYAEDTELTYRFTQNGGKILLVPNAEIIDTEPAWNTAGGNISNLRRRVLVLPEIKVFHEVRNRNFMSRQYYPGLKPIYWLNKFIFLTTAYFIGIVNGKFPRALLIHRAINAGEKMAADEACKKS